MSEGKEYQEKMFEELDAEYSVLMSFAEREINTLRTQGNWHKTYPEKIELLDKNMRELSERRLSIINLPNSDKILTLKSIINTLQTLKQAIEALKES